MVESFANLGSKPLKLKKQSWPKLFRDDILPNLWLHEFLKHDDSFRNHPARRMRSNNWPPAITEYQPPPVIKKWVNIRAKLFPFHLLSGTALQVIRNDYQETAKEKYPPERFFSMPQKNHWRKRLNPNLENNCHFRDPSHRQAPWNELQTPTI